MKKNAVLAAYACIPKEAKNYYNFRYWFTAGYNKYIDKIIKYCETNALIFQTYDDDWIYFDRLLSETNYECENQKSFLRTKKSFEYRDDNKHYLAIIRDYKLKGNIAPLNIVKDKIRNIIINKRKLDLIRNLDKSSLKDAMSQNKVEIF